MRGKKIHPLIALAVGLGAVILSGAGTAEVIEVTDPAKVFPPSLEEAKNYPYPYEDLIPGGWEALWHEIERRGAEGLAIDSSVIFPALSTYVLYEGRFPESIRELLDSPYSAIRASDLVDPLTQKPFSEVTPSDVFGRRFVVRQGADPRTTTIALVVRLRDPTTSAPVDVVVPGTEHSLYWYFATGPGKAKHGYRRGALPDAVLTAQAVEKALMDSEMEFRRLRGKPPTSLAELVATFPYLKKLRNAFTGGYASGIEWSATTRGGDVDARNAPPVPPGDFLVLTGNPRRGLIFIVFGPDGKEARSFWPAREDMVVYN